MRCKSATLAVVRASLLIAVAGLCVVGSDLATAADDSRVRTWTDRSGMYTVEATLEAYADGTVRLKKPGGDEIVLELEQLSTRDQGYVRRENRRRVTTRRGESTSAGSDHVASKQVAAEQQPESPPRRQLKANSEQLYGINWYDSPARAVAAKQDKPILWFRVLGDLDGFM